MNEASVIVRSSSAIMAEVDGSVVALDVDTGVCFGMNQVAARIWALIETPIAIRSVVEALLNDYDVDEETCLVQTLELIADLTMSGLAVVKE